jgi:hypothetical protein
VAKPVALRPFGLFFSVCAAMTLTGAPALSDTEVTPQVTRDGLVLQMQSRTRLVYLRPGAKFSPYHRMAVLDCDVQFRKNRARDYNEDGAASGRQVTDADIQRMKSLLAVEFSQVFIGELTRGGYQVVDTAASDVLALRPALINVDATASDLTSPGIDAVVVRSAGSMTLYLELWDSTTNTILARVMDAEADRNPLAPAASRVTDLQAAHTVLRSWADDLVSRLDAVHGKPRNP